METIIIILLAVAAAVALGLVLKGRETQRRIAAETRLAEAEKRIAELIADSQSAAVARLAAETELAAARQRVADSEQRILEFERLKEESLRAARAAVLTTAQEVSSKLLEDHK